MDIVSAGRRCIMWRDMRRQRGDILRDNFLTSVDELLDSQERVQVLLATVVSMAEDVGLDAILDRVVDSACELVGAQHGALGLIEEDGSLSHIVNTGIDVQQIALMEGLPAGIRVLEHESTVRVALQPSGLRGLGPDTSSSADQPPMTTFLTVPIRVREKNLGTIYLTRKAGGIEFSDEDEALCAALSAAAGVSIDNARHYEDNARRRRWLEAGVTAYEQILTAEGGSMPEILAMVGEHALAASDSSLAVIASARTDERLVCQASVGDQAVAAGREIWLQPAMAAILASGVAASVRRAADVFGPADADKMGPALVVPMDLDRLGHGILVLVRSDNAPPFMQEDVETSILFSSRMVLAVELVRERGLQQSLLLSEDRDKPPGTCTTWSSKGSTLRA